MLVGLRPVEQLEVFGFGHAPVARRQVGAEVHGLLGHRHEHLRMGTQILVEGGGAGLEGADDEDVGPLHAVVGAAAWL